MMLKNQTQADQTNDLIKTKAEQVEAFSREIQSKDKIIASLRTQVGQVDCYKDQIHTLRRQIQICQEKIKFYDRENNIKSGQIVQKAKFASTVQKELQCEIKQLEEKIQKQQITLSTKEKIITQLEHKFGLKQRKIKDKQRQIDKLGDKVVSLQSIHRAKDDDSCQKLRKFEAQLKDVMSEKKKMAEKIKALNRLLEDQNKQVHEGEMRQVDLKAASDQIQSECQKLRMQNINLHRVIDQLTHEAEGVQMLRQKTAELDSYIRQVTVQFQNQRRLSQEIRYERDQLQQEIQRIQAKYHLGPESNQNSLQGLKEIIRELQSELNTARRQNNSNSKQLNQAQDKLIQSQSSKRQLESGLETQVASIVSWISTYITQSNFYQENVQPPLHINRSIPPRTPKNQSSVQNSSRSSSRQNSQQTPKQTQQSNSHLFPLHKALSNARSTTATKFRDMTSQLQHMKSQLFETNELKTQILQDLQSLSTKITDNDNEHNYNRTELTRLQSQNINLNQELNRQKQMREEQTSTQRQLLLDFYHALHCIVEKFKNVQYVTRQLTNQQSLQLKAMPDHSPTAALSQIISLVCQITNIQIFQIKSLQLRVIQLDDSKSNWDRSKNQMYEQLNKLQQMKHQQVKKIEDAYDAKYAQFSRMSEDMEGSIKELNSEVEKWKIKCIEGESQREEMCEEVERYRERLVQVQRVKDTMMLCVMGMVYRIEQLVQQKRVALMIGKWERDKSRTQREVIDKLFERYKIEETLSACGGVSTRQIEKSNNGKNIATALRFRKCVIAVLAMIRIKKAKLFGMNIRGISEHLFSMRRAWSKNGNQLDINSSCCTQDDQNYNSQNITQQKQFSSKTPTSRSTAPHTTLALRNIFKRINFITIPGVKRCTNFKSNILKSRQQPSNKQLHQINASTLQHFEGLWQNIAEFIRQLRAHQAGYESGKLQSSVTQSLQAAFTDNPSNHQNSISNMIPRSEMMMMMMQGDDRQDIQKVPESPNSQQSSTNYAMMLMRRNDLLPRFDSLLSLLTQSFFHLKNNIYQSNLTSKTLLQARLKQITVSLFAKSDFVHSISRIQKFLEKIQKQSSDIFKTFKNIEKQRGVLHQRTGRLVLQNTSLHESLQQTKEQLQHIATRATQMYSPSKVNRLENQYEDKIRQFEQLSQVVNAFKSKDIQVQQQMRVLLNQKKAIYQKAMLADAKCNHLERDISLKDTQIQSLQNMIATRENQLSEVNEKSKNANLDKEKISSKISELDHEREKLIKDNIFLISQNQLLQRQIQESKQQDTKKELTAQSQINQYIEMIKFYNEKAAREEEIKKLYENNMKALQDRCQILQFNFRKITGQKQGQELKIDIDYILNKQSQSMNKDQQEEQKQQQHKKQNFSYSTTSTYMPVAQNYQRNLSQNRHQTMHATGNSGKKTYQQRSSQNKRLDSTSIRQVPTFMQEQDFSKLSLPTNAQSINFQSMQNMPSVIMPQQNQQQANMRRFQQRPVDEEEKDTNTPQATRNQAGGYLYHGDFPSEIKEESPSVEYGDKNNNHTPSIDSGSKMSIEKVPGRILKNS